MECTLATLIACFSWSNLYIDTTAEYIEQRDRRYAESFYGETLHVFGSNGEFIQRNLVREIDSIEREISSPYLRASIGYELDANYVRIDLSAFYQESAKASDRGEVGAALRVRFFPFRN
jgi:hypothetical protein